MSERDLYKLFSEFDGEVNLSDFSVEELSEMLGKNQNENYKEKYFSYYDDVKSPSLKKQDW